MTGGLAKTTYDDLVNEFEALLDQLILAGEIPLDDLDKFEEQVVNLNRFEPANAQDLLGRLSILKNNVADIHRYYKKSMVLGPVNAYFRQINYATALIHTAWYYENSDLYDIAFEELNKAYLVNNKVTTEFSYVLLIKLLGFQFYEEAFNITEVILKASNIDKKTRDIEVKDMSELVKKVFYLNDKLETLVHKSYVPYMHAKVVYKMLLQFLASKKIKCSFQKSTVEFDDLVDLGIVKVKMPIVIDSLNELYDLQDEFDLIKATYSVEHKIDISSLCFEMCQISMDEGVL